MNLRKAIGLAERWGACYNALEWFSRLPEETSIDEALENAPPEWRNWWIARTTREGAIIHPTAVVAEGAAIYPGVIVGQGAVVKEFCRIGEFSRIEPGAVVEENTVLSPHSLYVAVTGRRRSAQREMANRNRHGVGAHQNQKSESRR